MDQGFLLGQAQEVIDTHPGLRLDSTDDGIVLSGRYVLDGIYEDVPFYDEFDVEIRIPWGYPIELPTVRETAGRILTSKYGHVYEDGNLCLGATCDLIDRLQSSGSLIEYLDKVIPSYLFGFLYYEEYGVAPPFGERSHGFKGLKEAYKERYGVTQDIALYNLLFALGGDRPLRGHLLCPCGSGKKLRNCHGPALWRDRESAYFPKYKLEAAKIIHFAYEEMVEQREADRRFQTALRSGWKF